MRMCFCVCAYPEHFPRILMNEKALLSFGTKRPGDLNLEFEYKISESASCSFRVLFLRFSAGCDSMWEALTSVVLVV